MRDVTEAYLQLVRAASTLSDRVSCFNVASGEAQSIQSLLDRLRTMATKDFDVEVDESRRRPSNIEIDGIACDASRLRAATGWRPRYSIDDMLRSLLDYSRQVERAAG